MADQLHINAIGLVTDPNPLTLPPGALTAATNIVIQRPGVIEPRPGFVAMDQSTIVGGGVSPIQIIAFDGDLIVAIDDGDVDEGNVYAIAGGQEIAQSGDLAFDGGGAWGSGFWPARFALVRGNLYVTSSAGVMRITGADATTAERAGLMRPPQAFVDSFTASGTNYPLGADEAVAWRICETKEAGGLTLRSAPSARIVQRSYVGSSDKWSKLSFGLALDGTAEIYRSIALAEAYTDEPTDEMAMIGSVEPSATSFSDDTGATGTLGPALYTNATQQGALLENGITPICDDIAIFAGMLFFGAAEWAPSLTFDVLGIGPDWRGDSVSYGDRLIKISNISGTITSGSSTITGISSTDTAKLRVGMEIDSAPGGAFPADTLIESVSSTSITVSANATSSSTQFTVRDWIEVSVVDGSGTTTERIYCDSISTVGLGTSVDCREFLPVSNVGTSTGVHGAQDIASQMTKRLRNADIAATVSAFGDGVTLPWTFLVESYAAAVTSVTVKISNPNATPNRIDGTTGKTATRLGSKATLAWSKSGEPEHVPPGYQVEIGAADKAIQRIVPTRDSLFVFKEDGIWRVSGYGPDSLQVSEFDRTVTLIHPEACCAWAGGVAAWTNKGILLITEGGYTEIGSPIATSLASAEATLAGSNCRGCFLVGWVARDLLILGVPGSTTDGYAQQLYAWCSRTGAWSIWEHAEQITCATADADKLYFGCTGGTILEVNDDGPDASYDVTVLSVDGTTITIDAGSDWTPGIGDVLVSDGDAYSVVSASSATEFMVDRTGVSAGAATAEEGPVCSMTWAVAGGGDPGSQHMWREASLLFGATGGMDVMRWSISTDRQRTPIVFAQTVGEYATNGGQPMRVRSKVPRQVRRGNRLYPTLTISHARQQWSIEALSIVHEPIDTRFAGA